METEQTTAATTTRTGADEEIISTPQQQVNDNEIKIEQKQSQQPDQQTEQQTEQKTEQQQTEVVNDNEVKIEQKQQQQIDQQTVQPTLVVDSEVINWNETGVNYKETFENKDFHLQGWLWTHAVCRRLYMLIENKLNQPDWLKQPNKNNHHDLKQVIRSIRACDQWLKSHHLHEDNIVWPWLVSIIPETKDLLQGEMIEQHNQWDQLSNQLQQVLGELEAAQPGSDGDMAHVAPLLNQLKQIHHKVSKAVISHFVDEERMLIPHCLKVSKKDQLSVGDKIHKAVRNEKLAKFGFCAMMDLTQHDPIVAKSINSSIPVIIRKLLPSLWYKSEYKWYLKALE